MEQHQIVPDVISVAPVEVAKVTYAGGITVNQGNELKPRQVKDIPEVQWNADNASFYLLCMTDPDAPSRNEATYREWHHWFVSEHKTTTENQPKKLQFQFSGWLVTFPDRKLQTVKHCPNTLDRDRRKV